MSIVDRRLQARTGDFSSIFDWLRASGVVRILLCRPPTMSAPISTATIDVPAAPRARGARASPPVDLGIEAAEWTAFASTEANTLMVGEARAIRRALTAAWLTLRRPVFWCDGPGLSLPAGPIGTFVISRVDELCADDQQRLLAWLDRHGSTRVLSGSPRAIFPLVQQGAFVADLYYRLNPVLLRASRAPATAGD